MSTFVARLIVFLVVAYVCAGFMKRLPSPSGRLSSLRVGVATDKQSTQTSNGGVPADWSPSSWRNYPIKQPPNYPDPAHVAEVEAKIMDGRLFITSERAVLLMEEVLHAMP